MNPYSTEAERKAEESANNFIRLIAYQIKKATGRNTTPLIWRMR